MDLERPFPPEHQLVVHKPPYFTDEEKESALHRHIVMCEELTFQHDTEMGSPGGTGTRSDIPRIGGGPSAFVSFSVQKSMRSTHECTMRILTHFVSRKFDKIHSDKGVDFLAVRFECAHLKKGTGMIPSVFCCLVTKYFSGSVKSRVLQSPGGTDFVEVSIPLIDERNRGLHPPYVVSLHDRVLEKRRKAKTKCCNEMWNIFSRGCSCEVPGECSIIIPEEYVHRTLEMGVEIFSQLMCENGYFSVDRVGKIYGMGYRNLRLSTRGLSSKTSWVLPMFASEESDRYPDRALIAKIVLLDCGRIRN